MVDQQKKASYKPLWILIALCAFPYIAGSLYYHFQDQLPDVGTSNYGQLVQPLVELKDIDLRLLDGSDKSITDYRKKWLMLYVLDGECSEDCQKNIYFMRQIRKAMADERFRINRLLVLQNEDLHSESLKKILLDFQGMDVATINTNSEEHFYSTIQSTSGNIFRKIMLIDPLGNYMMEYDKEPDPELVLKDIKKLLSISRIG